MFEKKLVSSLACPTCGLQVAETLDACPNDGTIIRGAETAADSSLLERYKLLEPIGEGGMSVIYKARHLLMDKMVAIKLLHARLGGSQTSVKRFQMEAKAASLLNHPNIIAVHDFGVMPNGTAFLVMDYEPGESLAAYISSHGPLSPQQSLPLFKALADALDHAHQQGVLHRDLKPSNIMIVQSASGELTGKIVDFGIAKVLDPQPQTESGAKPQLTATGEVFGSPSYMSPEQCQGADLDNRSDIYSLGCLMYEALSGSPPFGGANTLEILFKQINQDVAPLVMPGNPRLETGLNTILKRCLAKDRDGRYAVARDIASDIAKLEQGGALADAAGSRQPGQQQPGLLRALKQPRTQITALLIVVAVALLNVFAFKPAQQPAHELHAPPVAVQNIDPNLRPPEDKPDGQAVAFPQQQFGVDRLDRRFTDADALAIFTPQRDYRRIDLSHTSITDISLKALEPYSHLTFLALDNTAVTDKGLTALKSIPSLEYLSLMNNEHIDSGGLASLSDLRGLKCLHLNRSPNIGDGGMKHLANLNKLTKIGLSYTRIGNEGMIYVLKTHPNLEHFSAGSPRVGDAAVIGMPVMSSLRSLRLQQSAITDKSLQIIADKCPKLTSLNIQETAVSYDGLKSLLLKLPDLKQLICKDCPNLSPEQLDLLKQVKPGMKINEATAEGR